jgi:cobaltochelatase CobT
VIIDPMHPLSFKIEREMDFRDTVVTLAAGQFRVHAPSDHGRGMCADILARTLNAAP